MLLRQAFDAPASAVLAADEFVGGSFVELELGRVPFEFGFWKAGGDAADEHRLGQETGVVEISGSAAKSETRLDEFAVMIAVRDVGKLEVLEFLVRIKERAVDVRQDQRAFGSDKDGTRVGPLIAFEQRKDIGGWFRITVVPRQVERFAVGIVGSREREMYLRINGPVPIVRRGAFRADRYRRMQADRIENRIEDVAAHVANGAGAELEAFAPVDRMIIFVADEGPIRANTQPKIPIEAFGNRIRDIGARRGVAPGFWAPGMHFFDLADDAIADELNGHAIMADRVDLDAHLGDQPFFMRELGKRARFVEIVRERFLAINMFAELHRAHSGRRVHVVGQRNIHGIDVFALFIEELAPILIDFDVRKALLELFGAIEIDFRNGDEFEVIEFGELVDVRASLARATKAGVAEDAVGRLRPEAGSDEGGGERGGTESFQE